MSEIVCGRCTHQPDAKRGEQAHHASVEAVKACYAYAATYGPENVFSCEWRGEVTVDVGDDEYGYEPYTHEVDCGAPAHANDDGWECFNGHKHLTYGSEAQQAEERIEAAVEHLASRDGNVAGRLDAGETWQQIAGV